MRGCMCGRLLICKLTVKMSLGLQGIEMLNTFKSASFEGTVPLMALTLPAQAMRKRKWWQLSIQWSAPHVGWESWVQYSPLFLLTYIKWFYGRRRQRSLRACKEVRTAFSSLVQYMASCQAVRTALNVAVVDFLSNLSHLAFGVQHLPEPQQDQKGHQGQMFPPFIPGHLQ